MDKKLKITLVGAGPGDPDLITLRGVKALEEADAVLYDALANDELLKYCKPEAHKVFVGKRRGSCAFSQDQINQLIIENAYKYGNVVRLKGGDPMVFGRAWEEIEFAAAFNIEVEVVPGITSAISVPALQGIPVTARGINESFIVTTGTTKNGEISQDLKLAAKSNSTVIILMAMSKLSNIIDIYKEEGKAEVPVAIIQNGSLSNEKIVLGTIETIFSLAEKQNVQNPAVIVIGEVVSLHRQFENALSQIKSLNK